VLVASLFVQRSRWSVTMSAAQEQAERDHGDRQAEVLSGLSSGPVPTVLPGLGGDRQEASTPL